MKKLFACIMLFSFAIAAGAQTATVKTWAFTRKVLPGAPPVEPAPGFTTEYYIYIAMPREAVPEIRGLWLEKKYYKATLQKVNSPVAAPDNPAVNYDKPDTLVPFTQQQVYQVIPGEIFKMKLAAKQEKNLTLQNGLVVFLVFRKKYLYGRVKKLKALPDLPLM